MSDFLKSAMGYFNSGPNGESDNDFVGQTVEIGSIKLRIKRVIAEGKTYNYFFFFFYYFRYAWVG